MGEYRYLIPFYYYHLELVLLTHMKLDFLVGVIRPTFLLVLFLGYYFFDTNLWNSCSDFRIADGIFGSCFFSLTGFHGFHVVVGLCLLVLPLSRLLVRNSYYGKFAGLECSMIY